MLLTRYPFTVTNPTGIKLTPQPPKPAQSSFLAKDLPLGALASWSNTQLTASLAATGGPQVVTVGGERVVRLDGVDDRLSTAGGPAWRGVSMLVYLGASTGEDYLYGPNTASNGQIVWNSATNLVYFRNGTAATISVPASQGWHVITATITAAGGNATISCDKVHAGGVIAAEAPPAGLRVGGHFSSGQYAAVDISEIQEWDTVPSPADIEAYVDYCKAAHPTLFP